MSVREPKKHELMLVKYLIEQAEIQCDLIGLKVLDMNDGGMGSIKLIDDGSKRKCGRMVSDCQFIDEDNYPVIVSLFLDENDQLFELDIWKVNLSPTIKFPIDVKQLRSV